MLVYSAIPPESSLDISNFVICMYFLRIQEGDHLYSARVVKE